MVYCPCSMCAMLSMVALVAESHATGPQDVDLADSSMRTPAAVYSFPCPCPRGSIPSVGSSHACIGLPLTNSHNVRSAKLTFHIPHAGVLHGFGGYFEAVLYGNVGISIHPERMALISKDMLSWFPLFFPLKVSLFVALFDGSEKAC